MRALRRYLLTGEHVCPWWFAYTFDNRVRRLVHPPEKVLGNWVKEGATAVDVGCGMGHFSLGMARLVGGRGRVVAVDLQQEMLDILGRRAQKAGVGDRIERHRCRADALGISVAADFVLTFWMVHEVVDRERFLHEVHDLLKAGGTYFLAEPLLHVSAKKFRDISEAVAAAGFRIVDRPRVALSRAAVFQKVSTASAGSKTG